MMSHDHVLLFITGAVRQNVVSPSPQHQALLSQQQQQHQRPIVGAYSGVQNSEITRLLEQQIEQQLEQQQNQNMARNNIAAAHGMGMGTMPPGHGNLQTGGVMHPGVNRPVVPNAAMMQRMMSPGMLL